MTRHDTLILLAITIALWAASLTGLPQILGAHPWWAQKAGLVGSTLGAIAFAMLRWMNLPRPWLIGLSALALAAAILAAVEGKAIFVAAYGQAPVAGRLWFFGWFALMGSLGAFASALLVRR